MRILLALLLVLASLSANAETIKVSPNSSLEVTVPEGFQVSNEQSPFKGESPSTIISMGEIRIMFSPFTISNQEIVTLGGINKLHKMFFEGMVPDSVEQTFTINKLNDIGVFTELTDAQLVGKPKEKGNFLLATMGIIQGDNGVLTFVVLYDSKKSTEYQSIMSMLNTGKIIKSATL